MKDSFQDSLGDLALRLKAVIETAIDGIITINQVGIIETINPAGAELFGYEPGEVIGENIKILMPSPYQEEHDGYIRHYRDTGEKRIIGIGREVVGLKKNGAVFPFRLSVSEVRLTDRVIYTGIVHDISKEKAAEEQLRQLNKGLEERVETRTEELGEAINKLLREVKERKAAEDALRISEDELKQALNKEKELNELKSRFVSMASHEFRTPLSTILSSAGLLGRYVETSDQPKRERHIAKIKSAVSNLTGILNDFLSLSKLEEGKIGFDPKPQDFNVFCAALIEEINPLLKQGQVIHLEVLEGEGIVNFDERLTKNSLINLLTNASKYSDEGDEIRLRANLSGQVLTIKVIDKGIGIPEEEKQYLFTRFFRANNVVNIKGTGLGLTIVKRYMDLMNGSISFESKAGIGSTFTLRIPIPRK
ncbi:MAG: PAS domain-containing sensor histidine kinase [Bacteroidota bacterium]